MSTKPSDNSNIAVALKTEFNESSVKNYRWRDVVSEDGSEDVLQELKNNINRLETVHARLQFMMNEISGIVKRS